MMTMIEFDKFMRLIVMFDLPTETKKDLKSYRDFIKFLKSEGYIRINYSVYCKLCINHDSINTYSSRLKSNSPKKGDVRYLIITERQYQSISNINNTYNLIEQITTVNRTVFIGGFNDENI